MTPGLRTFKSASCRVAIPMIVDDDELETQRLQDGIREVLSVQSGNARKGHASGLMRSVCTEADVGGVMLLIQVRAFDDGLSDEQLMSFYSKFGFEKIQSEPVLMMRTPRG